ncbi:hypothetical protein [Kamptonema formosum]|uniref:hypothetical protein n=1 Tax=Kamptonema formosum TaxID=331992 RepID=UPI000347781C|nr:hypothetical protein [Oscillatoria sp. PCC 10802]
MKQLYIAFCAAILWLPSVCARATTYVNPTGSTSLVLAETNNKAGGYYHTTAGGRNFLGDITITRAEGAAGSYYYTGTFRDRTIGPGSPMSCSGDITIVRRAVGRSATLGAEVTWKVKGGENCPSAGKTFKVSLVEPLPRPDAKGDYTPQNANTWVTETSGTGTWPKWRVTSADGKLNCRQTPNGTIKQVYRSQDTVVPELRQVNAIELSGGSPWMRTNKNCYVRANSSYIEPISLPE